MGNYRSYTIYLTEEEESKIRKMIDEKKFRSVYAFIKKAVRKELGNKD